jgi:hypothetical protein
MTSSLRFYETHQSRCTSDIRSRARDCKIRTTAIDHFDIDRLTSSSTTTSVHDDDDYEHRRQHVVDDDDHIDQIDHNKMVKFLVFYRSRRSRSRHKLLLSSLKMFMSSRKLTSCLMSLTSIVTIIILPLLTMLTFPAFSQAKGELCLFTFGQT